MGVAAATGSMDNSSIFGSIGFGSIGGETVMFVIGLIRKAMSKLLHHNMLKAEVVMVTVFFAFLKSIKILSFYSSHDFILIMINCSSLFSAHIFHLPNNPGCH